MKEKEDKTREILAIQAAKKVSNAGADTDAVWINPPTECVLIPGDYDDFEELVIDMILDRKLSDCDLSELFDYLNTEDDPKDACELYIHDNYTVE